MLRGSEEKGGGEGGGCYEQGRNKSFIATCLNSFVRFSGN